MKSPLHSSPRKRLEKKAKEGFRGYPLGASPSTGRTNPHGRRKMVAAYGHGER